MKRDDIIKTIKMLAMSQGFYCRLLDALNDLNTEDYNNTMSFLESQNFNDTLDLVLYFEA